MGIGLFAIDQKMTNKIEVLWPKILVKLNEKDRPSTINILEDSKLRASNLAGATMLDSGLEGKCPSCITQCTQSHMEMSDDDI